MGGFFHTIGARVARTTLDGVDGGVGNHLEHFFGLLADVLHPTMARNLVADVAQALGELGFQQTIALACHQVFKRVPHVLFDQLRLGIVGVHERQLLLEHQGARRHGAQNGVTLTRIFGEDGDVDLFVLIYRFQVAQFQLGHTAAFFFGHQLIRDVVVVEDFEQIHANARLVVVDIASGINHHLARCFLAIHHFAGLGLRCLAAEFGGCQFGQPCVFVHAQSRLHQRAGHFGFVDGVDRLNHDGNAGKLAMYIGGGQ